MSIDAIANDRNVLSPDSFRCERLTEPGVTWVPPWVAARLTDKVRAVVIDERGALAECEWAGSFVRPTLID